MVSTFTPNLQIEEPARGDDVGTWDTPVNNNSTLLDLVGGGVTTIALNNSPVVLSAAQFRCKTLVLSSTLTGNVTITFPTSFIKSYEIFHLCTGSSAFTITLTTTGGGQAICPPPGEITDCVNNGPHIFFKNLGRVGEYWDYAGSSVPNWVSGCTVAPYLACTGVAVSSQNYPVLFSMIGATTPDQRGRTRYALDAGANRVTAGQSNVNGNTILAGGGDQLAMAHTHTAAVTDPGHTHVQNTATLYNANGAAVGGATGSFQNPVPGTTTAAATTGISVTVNSNLSGGSQNMPPLLVHGITLIRAG